MIWYGMVSVDLYSTIITKVSNALNTLVPREKPGFQALSKGLIVLLCTIGLRFIVQNQGISFRLEAKTFRQCQIIWHCTVYCLQNVVLETCTPLD